MNRVTIEMTFNELKVKRPDLNDSQIESMMDDIANDEGVMEAIWEYVETWEE